MWRNVIGCFDLVPRNPVPHKFPHAIQKSHACMYLYLGPVGGIRVLERQI